MASLIPFFVWSSELTQGQFLPRVWVLGFVSVLMIVALFLRSETRLPCVEVMAGLGAWFTLSVVSGAVSLSPWLSHLNTAVTAAAVSVFLYVLNLDRRVRRIALVGIVSIGVFQLLTLVWPPLGLPGRVIAFDQDGRWIGTVGNAEFLATLLGVGIFCCLHFLKSRRQGKYRSLWLVLGLVLFAEMVLTRNKGGVGIVLSYLVWSYAPRRWWVWGLIPFGIVISGAMFPSGVIGRVFLWMTGIGMFVSHPILGVGPGQFINHYIETVGGIFSHAPWALKWFGAHTASARDVHNQLLTMGIELGLGGLILGGAFYWFGFRLSGKVRQPLQAGLAFLLVKSLYTVVLSSGTGAVLLAIFFAVNFPLRWLRRRPPAIPAGTVLIVASLLGLVVVSTWAIADLHLYRGTRHMIFGEYAEARSEAKAALRLVPEYADAWLTLGQIDYFDRSLADMEGALAKAATLHRDMDTLKKSAHLYFLSGQYAKAQPIYSTLLTAYPQHLTSMARLAQIYVASGDRGAAHEIAQRLLRTVPRVPSKSDLRNIQIARSLLID